MEVVGFSGYARSGKDTAAEALMCLGFVRVSFADKLREFLYEFNPTVWSEDFSNNDDLQHIIDFYGWDGYKQTTWGKNIRHQLQVLGTECGRKIIDDNIWVNALFNGLSENGKYVIADVRFPNEVDGIRNRGGRMYRIERAGIGPANNHFSEIALDHYEFDGFIHNDGSIQHFQDSVRRRALEGRN